MLKEGIADDIVDNEDSKVVGEPDLTGDNEDNVRLKSPMKVKWLAPLCYQAVAATPNISTKELVAVLSPYVIDLFLTNALIQTVRTTVRSQVFGDPDTNICYLKHLKAHLEENGHDFSFVLMKPIDVRKRLLNVILEQKVNALKKENKYMTKVQKISFLEKWEEANREMLHDAGLDSSCSEIEDKKFLSGVFLSIAPAIDSVPLLQTVYQADAAHTNFGKYTLYSCYGISANCNAFPVAMAIIFGNEDKEGWSLFWKFASTIHPSLNHPSVTIITDQQKGSVEAMAEVIPDPVNFFCSYHRQKNILTQVKGGKGEYSAHWYYQLLLGCGRIETIDKNRFDVASSMDVNALRYIHMVNDHQQFPAARVAYGAAIGHVIYMYQRSSSSTAESMNAANKSMRSRTAVDPINAIIILLKLESERYNHYRNEAWEWKEALTPHGKRLAENAFKNVNLRNYSISVDDDHTDRVNCTVTSNRTGYLYRCWFPRTYDDNSTLFGGCSCGVPNTDGMPCPHMCAVVKSYRIEGLNEVNVMPIWYHTSHWQKQYPFLSTVRCNFDITTLRNDMKKDTEQHNKEYRLCPPYSAGRKSGRPSEGKRIKGSMERGVDKKKKLEQTKKRKKKDEPVSPDDEEEYASRMQKKKKKTNVKSSKKHNKIGYKRPPRGTKTSDGKKNKKK